MPMLLSDNRDFFFHPTIQASLTLFVHIMHHDTKTVLVKNTSERPLRILRCQNLCNIVDICYNNGFLADAKFDFNSATVLPLIVLFFEHELFYTLTFVDLSMETRLDNGVKVYRKKHAVALLAQLIAKYLSIWELKGFVQILLDC